MLDVEDIMARYRRSKARILETSHADEIHLKSKRVVPRPLLLIGFGGIAFALIMCFVSFGQLEAPYTYLFRRSAPNWHLEKKSWKSLRLDNRQTRAIADAVNIERLYRTLLPIMVVRTPDSGGSRAVAQHLSSQMIGLGWDLVSDRFEGKPPHPYPRLNFTNIIATKHPGVTRRLVLACHYDSKITPVNFIGAIDSAVPCAMMIEIANALQNHFDAQGNTPQVTLQLLFFDGEEAFVQWTSTDSTYGARNLARLWQGKDYYGRKEIEAIDLFVLLDLIGTSDTIFRNYQATPTRWYKHASDIERRLKQLRLHNSATQHFPLRPIPSWHRIEDDHIPFQQAGVPILHLIPSPFPKVWHTLQDNFDALDKDTIAHITRVLAVFVAEYLHLSPVI